MSDLKLMPHPMDPAFAPSAVELKDELIGVSPGRWAKTGGWKHRQFSNEVQLRHPALPHLTLDLFRSEAEDLYQALGVALGQPAPLPYRLGRWARLSQWWSRKVWNRRHHAELDAARRALLDDFTRRGPWG